MSHHHDSLAESANEALPDASGHGLEPPAPAADAALKNLNVPHRLLRGNTVYKLPLPKI